MDKINNRELIRVLCEQGNDTISIDNPATGKTIGYIPSMSEEDINALIDKSAIAQQQWSEKTAKERADILLRWYQLIIDNADDLARIMTIEQGKPLSESRGEVLYGASFVQWFAEEGKRAYGEVIPSPRNDRKIITLKQPVGVTAAITPWNFPIAMITRKAAPALAAGCSMLIKPANQTPLSAYAIATLAHQAGIPEDCLTIVSSTRSSVIGKLFCQHPTISKLSFTGSTQVGRILMRDCAESIKRTSMELGGNAPFIVFDDADIDAAVEGAIASKFRNGGQTCVCANRFYVHQDIHDSFVEKFAQAMAQLTVGDGIDSSTQVGPLIDEKAKQNTLRLLTESLKQGATLVAGGEDRGGRFVTPALLTNVTSEMSVAQEEIFGPIAPIIRFSDEQNLIKEANNTIYGLASYFYSKDINRIFRVAEALQSGMVGVNEGIISTEVAPFGGVKQSGIGREGARLGLDEYLNIKYICLGGM
ncbi:NAD-dependent succinate-semialdehyde dehydrogenase [Veronia pacifica]|uniref:Succinate-semialdehyde dehydrogenase (NADP(+)) n=1 Tax=Veronia pacifica TaxID=1080227 RepID=A0A1C3EF46_9GAMM|nr:NAD-dependent succinate-semialdehyde dehydrogenase [Veronia pacifica]ODA31824.1 succinate-semialdehyde dehydrogenase (NADP(+)) [Veronia pacifica]